MSENGFLMLSRLLKDDPFWKNFSTDYRSIFITILLNCAWKDTIQDDHGEPTVVLKGQCLMTERQIIEGSFPPTKDAKKLAKYKSACHRSLIFFEKVGFSNHKKNHKKMLHTITKDYLLKAFEPNFEPTANQARTKLEPQKNKIRTEEETDLDLNDARETADDSEILEFDHKKSGSIKSTVNKIIEVLKPDWPEKEIHQAIKKMKKQNPCLNGTIEAYLKPILKTQKKEPKICKTSMTKSQKTESTSDKGYYMGNDLSEAPLAKYARQNGCKSQS
jgi:hypothetical protein